MSPLAGPLARLVPAADTRPDGDLLAAFLHHRDEAAFAELVRRHGPVVRAACRRVLPNPADAEDAFQAAFLVLARRGPALDPGHTLGPWLHRVAVLTARTVRRGNARRFARLEPPPPDLAAAEPVADLRLDLDAALLALPEKYRVPLVLCHLQGWSRREAAEEIGCPEGTLSSLLARGLTKLKDRLRGYDPTAALAAGAVPIPLALATATAKAAAGGERSPAAARAADAVVRGFRASRLTTAAGAVLALVATGYGVVAAVHPPAPPAVAAAPAPEGSLEPSAAVPAPPRRPPPLPVSDKRIDVCLGGPFGAVPLRVTAVGPGGPLGEPVMFTTIARFQSYMAAARTAGPAPPAVRVDVWDESSPTTTRRVFQACRGAGYSSVRVRGRVQTLNSGWREYDDDAVDLAELAPPPTPAPAKAEKAGGCTFRPDPCHPPTGDA